MSTAMSTTEKFQATAKAFEAFYELISVLRGPGGCPWDREQSIQGVVQNILEEYYECVDEIQADNPRGIAEEMGDMYLTLSTLALLLEEEKGLKLEDILGSTKAKLIRRHPHIFGEEKLEAQTAEEVLEIWNKQKAQDKEAGLSGKGHTTHELLSKSQKSAPPAEQSYDISKAMRKAGYSWEHIGGALDMVARECAEAKECLDAQGDLPAEALDAFVDEIGDIYFSLANVLTFIDTRPSLVQQRVNNKVMARFSLMREKMAADGLDWDADADKREIYWDRAKAELKRKSEAR